MEFDESGQAAAAEAFWQGLSDEDRERLLGGDHRLPPDFVVRMVHAGVLVAGVKWEQDPEFVFQVPESLTRILERERGGGRSGV